MNDNEEETFEDVLAEYIDHKKMNGFEGRKGIENLCRLAAALGYKDRTHFGQFSSEASIGDLLQLLEDNSGIMEEIVNKISEYGNDEWKENLLSHLPEKVTESDQSES